MSEPSDLTRTVDESPSDPLDVGLAAAFGPDSGPPLSAAGSVAQALGVPPIVLRSPDGEREDPVVKTAADPSGRYRIDGEIARGGMGAILKGRDVDLGRDIAVKVLLETHQGMPATRIATASWCASLNTRWTIRNGRAMPRSMCC